VVSLKARHLFFLAAVLIFALYASLGLSLFYFLDPSLFLKVLKSPRTLYALKLSLFSATVVTLVCLVLGLPAAYALSRYRFPGKTLMDILLELPLLVSPAALGAMILIFFNQPLGQFLTHKGFKVVFSVGGVLVAQLVTCAGLAVRLLKAVIDEIPPRYEEVARTLGFGPGLTFLKVVLPLSRRGILSAAVLTWAKALGEFGATITVAGTMPFRTETLPIAIFMKLSVADLKGAVVLILILLFWGLAGLFLVRWFMGERKGA